MTEAIATLRELHDLRLAAYQHDGGALSQLSQQIDEPPARVRVERMVSFIEEDDFGLLDQLTDDRDALPQAPGQHFTSPDSCVESFRQALYGVVETEKVGKIERLVDAFTFLKIGKIVENCAAIDGDRRRRRGAAAQYGV